MIVSYWLCRGDSACVKGAAEFLRQTVTSLPKHVRIGLVRGDSGFGDSSVVQCAENEAVWLPNEVVAKAWMEYRVAQLGSSAAFKLRAQ